MIMTERSQNQQYNRRVLEIEHGSFTPLVFSSYSGCSPDTDRFIIKERSTKVAEKQIRSAVLCIRGPRSIQNQTHTIDPTNVDIAREMGNGDRFYHAMHYSAKRGLAITCRLSVRPSVCPSVTLVDHDHIGGKSWKLIA